LTAAVAIAVASRIAGIERDTAVAIVVTALFGLGVLLALSPSSPPGVQNLLFGDLLGVSASDLVTAAGLTAAALLGLAFLHRRLRALVSPPPRRPGAVPPPRGAARRGGGPLLAALSLLALVAAAPLIAVRALGTLLVAAVLVAPAATAQLLTRRLLRMMSLAI